jgi:ribosome-associated translation inhibitor RaiA
MANVPLQIKFLHMRRMASIEKEIIARAEDLSTLHGRITGCHVSVEVPDHSKHSGNTLEVRISLALAGRLVVIRKTGIASQPSVVVHQAFETLKRQLKKTVEKKITKRKKG